MSFFFIALDVQKKKIKQKCLIYAFMYMLIFKEKKS